MEENRNEKFEIEGRNAVMEAFRSGKTVDKLYLQDGCHDGSINSIVREAKKQETIINYVSKEKLNQMSSTGKHQGVIAHVAAYECIHQFPTIIRCRLFPLYLLFIFYDRK